MRQLWQPVTLLDVWCSEYSGSLYCFLKDLEETKPWCIMTFSRVDICIWFNPDITPKHIGSWSHPCSDQNKSWVERWHVQESQSCKAKEGEIIIEPKAQLSAGSQASQDSAFYTFPWQQEEEIFPGLIENSSVYVINTQCTGLCIDMTACNWWWVHLFSDIWRTSWHEPRSRCNSDLQLR